MKEAQIHLSGRITSVGTQKRANLPLLYRKTIRKRFTAAAGKRRRTGRSDKPPAFCLPKPQKTAFCPQTGTISPQPRMPHPKPSSLCFMTRHSHRKKLLPEPPANAEFTGAAPSQTSRRRRDDSFFSIVKRFKLMPVALEIFLYAGGKTCAVIQAVHSSLR